MVARPYTLLAVCMMLGVGLAGCTEHASTEFTTEISIDGSSVLEPLTYRLATGHTLRLDDDRHRHVVLWNESVEDHSHRTPSVDQDGLDHHASPGDEATVRECIAWDGPGPSFFPRITYLDEAPHPVQWSDRGCPRDGADDELQRERTPARSTDFTAIMGRGNIVRWFDGTEIAESVDDTYVAAVEHGDCDPMTGTDFRPVATYEVGAADGQVYRTLHIAYRCTPGSDEERLYLTHMVGRTDAQKESGLPAWLLVVDTCDGRRLGTESVNTSRVPCTDGRPGMFDDMPRGSVLHTAGTDAAEDHRPTCRDPAYEWAPWRTVGDGAGCADEMHATVLVDIRYYDDDPSSLWNATRPDG